MSPENRRYYEDMVVYIRSSRLQEAKSEELLLEIAQHLSEAQARGRTARDVFGDDPEAYCKELVAQLPKMKGLSALQFHLVVPWITLTWFFFVQAAAGFIAMWVGGPSERITQVGISTIVIMACSSYILIHSLLFRHRTGWREAAACKQIVPGPSVRFKHRLPIARLLSVRRA
ncbi:MULTISPECIES: DUF1129 family protein [Cohnella]|uniref:DUF1129 family protein n=1 Tax=Cohnella TaxID=329857 RepID=UPI001F07B156|nr:MULTISPECIES: DUF1129 family protein [Cohnella]